ncbi:MAG TPA: hypothetical protein VJY36_03870 [Candidatus Bathyarchaeia archaeon]|nr:hypothetical protein [Candidatus Bathyarchaeia archaeon]
MDIKSKTSALILTVIVALSFLTLLTAKPTSAQNNTNPSISILYPTDSTVFNVSIEGVYLQLLYQTNDTISWAGYSINGGANVTCTGNVTDNSAYIKDDYQFDFGHPTLTLYANDTAGNWAFPQTVTYTVYFYPDTTSLPSSVPTSASSTPTPTLPNENGAPNLTPNSTATATSTPTVPEIPTWIILPLFAVAILLSTVFIRKRIPIR